MPRPKTGIPSLTPKRDQVLAFIRNYKLKNDLPPTVREIKAGLGISSESVVSYYLNQLIKEGKISITPDIARGIKVIEHKP